MRGKIQRGITEGILFSPDYEEIILIEKETKEDKQRIKQIIENPKIEILSNYNEKLTKKDVKDFVKLYNNRLKKLSSILRHRQELAGATSISKIQSFKGCT